MTKDELMDAVIECDGYEVPDWDETLWPLAKTLEAEGKVTIGPARGPGRAWHRVEPKDETRRQS